MPSFFDFFIILICSLSTMLGMYKGMLKLLLGLVMFTLSLVITWLLLKPAECLWAIYIKNEIFMHLASIITSYVSALIICSIASSKISNSIDSISGGIIDRFLGTVIGFARGVFISILIFSFAVVISTKSYIKADNANQMLKNVSENKYPKWLNTSISTPFLENTIIVISDILPDSIIRYGLKKITFTNWYKPYNKSLNTKEDLFKQYKEDEISKEIKDILKE